MKKFLLLLACWLPFIAAAHASPPRMLGHSEPTEPTRTVTHDGSSFTLEYSLPSMSYHDKVSSKLELSVPGDMFAPFTHIGDYRLPRRIESFEIPTNGEYEISVEVLDSKVYQNVVLEKTLSLSFDDGGSVTTIPSPLTVLEKAALKSASPASKLDNTIYRGHHIGHISIQPAYYDEHDRTLTVYHKFAVKVKMIGETEELSQPVSFIAEEPILQEIHLPVTISNVEDEDTPERLAGYAQLMNVPRYIILTVSEFLPYVENFADWKRLMGYNVKVITQPSGLWDVGTVESTLRSMYAESKGIDAVLIVGDYDLIPSPIITDPLKDFPSDYQYMCLDGYGDTEADVLYGRIPASNHREVTAVLNKIMVWERKSVNTKAYYSNIVAIARFEDEDGDNGYGDGFEDRAFVWNSETMARYLGSNGYKITRCYNASSASNPTNWSTKYPGGGQEIPSYLKRPNFAWRDGASAITTAIKNMPMLVAYRGHGTSHSLYMKNQELGLNLDSHDYSFTAQDFKAAIQHVPGAIYFNSACLTCAFHLNSSAGPCLGTQMILPIDGGAIGVLGASGSGYTTYNNYFYQAFFESMWNPTDSVNGWTNSKRLNKIGDIIRRAQETVSENGATSSYSSLRHKRMCTYFGDPTMRVFLDVPKQMSYTQTQSSTDIILGTPVPAIFVFHNRRTGRVVGASGRNVIYPVSKEDRPYISYCIFAKDYIPAVYEGKKYTGILQPVPSIGAVQQEGVNLKITLQEPLGDSFDDRNLQIRLMRVSDMQTEDVRADYSNGEIVINSSDIVPGLYNLTLLCGESICDTQKILIK